MPAKPLTEEQLADATRLRTAFEEFQKARAERGEPSSQDDLADLLPFGQSALSQYLRGRIPLNPEALLAFSNLIGVDPSEISPGLAARERDRCRLWIPASEARFFVGEPQRNLQSQRPDLAATLMLLGQHLAALDSMAREAIAPLLQRIAHNPREAEDASHIAVGITSAKSKRA